MRFFIWLQKKKNDESNMGEFFLEKERKKESFLQKTHFWLFLWRPREGYKNEDILPADVIETTKSMFAAQEKIMSLLACIYVRACVCYACVKNLHRRSINNVR